MMMSLAWMVFDICFSLASRRLCHDGRAGDAGVPAYAAVMWGVCQCYARNATLNPRFLRAVHGTMIEIGCRLLIFPNRLGDGSPVRAIMFRKGPFRCKQSYATTRAKAGRH